MDGAFTDPSRTTIVDLFAGVGNNAISFALQPHPEDPARRRWGRVVAVERDPATLACAQHNAALHGLGPESVVWVLGDSFAFLEGAVATAATAAGGEKRTTTSSSSSTAQKKAGKKKTAGRTSSDANYAEDYEDEDEDEGEGEHIALDPATTVLFASPPWGGPGYSTDAVFDLDTMEPYNLARLHGAYRAMDHALYLPRTSDLRQIASLAPPPPPPLPSGGRDGDGGQDGGGSGERKRSEKIEVVQYCVEGASKALVAYIPAAPTPGTAAGGGGSSSNGAEAGAGGEESMEID